MSRTFGARDFSAATVRLLEEVQPWLCHLLAKTAADPALTGEEELATGDTGVLILDPSGKIESASPGAVNLLLNAVDVAVEADSLRHALGSDAGSLLKRLARAVGASVGGKPAPLPAGTFRNRYGLFKLRAYALDAFASSGGPRVSVHIERRAPLSQRLFSAPRFLALPNREREVALCLARGRSNVETAAHLDVKPSSVIDAIRSLYHRLNIDSRSKLVPALLRESA